MDASVEHSQDLQFRIRQANRQIRDQAEQHAQTARNLMQEQPLMLGALGVATGALIGALLPATEAENNLLGGRADEVKSKLADKASQMSSDTASSVSAKAEELRRKGEEQLASIEERHDTPVETSSIS